MPRYRPRRDDDEGRRRPSSPPRRPRSPPRQDRRDRDAYRNNADPYRSNGDSYRPPQGDFTFRVGGPGGAPNFPSAPFPSNGRPGGRGGRRDGNRGGRGGRGGRRWQPPPHLSERALFSDSIKNLPEEALHDKEGAAKFRDLDELSDDDEQEMEISSHSSQSDSEKPSKKRSKTAASDSTANAAPKWSNSDPYAALPCPDETQQKKRDVVALIRKARNEEAEKQTTGLQEADEFIAFESSEDEEEEARHDLPPKPPTEPPPPLPSGPPPPLGMPDGAINGSIPIQRDLNGPLGSRKRTANDEIKPPNYGKLKKASMKPAKGLVVHAWEPKPDEDPCPWATVDHSGTPNVAFR